jgi:predicted AAA+ superfamily ATPase
LVHRLPAFFINTKKRLVKAPYVYQRDSGLLHQLSGVNTMTSLRGHPVVGTSWEGYIVEQIKQAKPSWIDMYYYRTQAGAEYDIVLARGIRPVACIEVKLNNAPSLSRGNLQSIAELKTKRNFVVVPDMEDYKTKEGIVICNMESFLTKHLVNL